MTRSVRDTWAFHTAIEKNIPAEELPPIGDISNNYPANLRIAVLTENCHGKESSDVLVQATHDVAGQCKSLGHEVKTISNPFYKKFDDDFWLLWAHLAFLVRYTGKDFSPKFDHTQLEQWPKYLISRHWRNIHKVPLAFWRLRRFVAEYEKFFQSALKKFKIDSPADLKTDDKKKEFFNYIDKNYKAKEEDLDKEDETSVKKVIKGLKKAVDAHSGQVKSLTKDISDEVDLEEVNAKVIMDKDQGNRDLQKLLKKHKLKMKTLQKNVNPGYDEVEISGDKRDMEKMMKTTGDDDMYKFNPRTKEFELDESKKLEAKTTKDVDETLEKIREANIQKGKSMRSILADIWKMNEGKSPFEKEEGFSSDAQRKAAFASGYKEKGKKGKKEEDEKSSKTATGQKPTKVEIEPEVE